MKIVADNTVPFLKGIAEPIAEVKYLTSKEFTPENVQDADILIVRSIDKCTRELLEGSRVKLITSATIGFDHIDTRYCDKAGITWKNSPGCNAVSVAQYVLSGLVTIALRKGEPLQGKTIGIVGVGHVGKEVEKLCSAYGMNVLRNDPPRAEKEGKDGFVSLETIAEQADIVTFHTPLTKEGRFATRHLAGVDFFRKLQRKPWFVNASRGTVHDTDALLHARKEGKISELILDCWENEPDINRELLELATIATPHIACFSAPETPVIDLNRFDKNRIEQAILTSFNPLAIDRALRENPDRFEWFRTNYHHPREYGAYTIVHATPEETGQLRRLGFGIQQ